MFQFTHPGRGATKRKKLNDYRKGLFQFTHPGRGATCWACAKPPLVRVSIHAPREGCDGNAIYKDGITNSFNSRTPGGVRLQ